jgi:glycosyltransferase involved in cell wall biosynthesis
MQVENLKKLTVCIVTYNHEKYIGQCLESVVEQLQGLNAEIIVSDDCSKDNTPLIVRQYMDKFPALVKGVLREKNVGSTANYLQMHAMATGEYIAHLDGDDYALSGKFAKQISYLENNPDCIAVVHQLANVSAAGESLGTFWPNMFQCRKYDLPSLVRHHPDFGHSALMYKRGAYDGLFKENPVPILDFYVYVHLAGQGHIGAIPEVLGAYRTGVGVSSGTSFHEMAIDAIAYAEELGLPVADRDYAMARQYLLFAKKALVEQRLSMFSTLIDKSWTRKHISLLQAGLYVFKYFPTLPSSVYQAKRRLRSWFA